MKVKDIMSSDLNYVDPNASVQAIAQIMKQQDVGAVPVLQADNIVGIITDRDIILRALAGQKDVSQVTAEQIMTVDPVCVEENWDIDRAADMMAEYQIKRLPVTSKGRLVGMLALGDLAIEQIHMDEAGEALSGISRGISH